MSQLNGETIVRIEHKLDAILFYLRNLTGEMPIALEKPIPGLNGLTNGKCPITNTDIYLRLDAKEGKIIREDGLRTGLIEGGLPAQLDTSLSYSPFVLGGSGGSDDST